MPSPIELLTLLSSTIPAASGTGAVTGILGFEDGVLVRFLPTQVGNLPRLNAPASRPLVRADSRGGIITSTIPGTTILTLPTMAQLGYVRNATNPMELFFLFQRGGLGPLFVNSCTYLGSVASQSAMLALSAAQVCDYCFRSDLGQSFYLTAAGPATLGNWTAHPTGAANQPNTTGLAGSPGVAINWATAPSGESYDPQYLPQHHAPVMLTSNGLDSYEAS